MDKEYDYVDYFYGKFHGRVAIGVGYNQNMSEIYPLVFQNADGESIGIVALGFLPDKKKVVYIYHLGAFVSRCGDGSEILRELCRQADKFNICLRVGAVFMANGKDPEMAHNRLIQWYRRFGFKGDAGLLRYPCNNP